MTSADLVSGLANAGSPEDSLQIDGTIVRPGDPTYNESRHAWNLCIDQHPALIVHPENTADIQKAVRHAAGRSMAVAVQSTGHGVGRKADQALLIRTSLLDQVEIYPDRRTARVQAGVKWGQVLRLAQEHGLAPLLGSSPEVGVVGYTLGGGFGWLGRKFGMALDSVLSLQIITAQGELVRASASENSDLFWAVRGGGGGFGVVAEMEIQLYPVTTVYAGNLLYPADSAGEVLSRFAAWSASAPDELTSAVTLMNFPPIPDIPEPLRGRSFAMLRGCYCGAPEVGEALINSWREWQAPAMDLFQAMPFTEAARISSDPTSPMPASATSAWLKELNPQAIEALIRYTFPQQAPPVLVFSEVRQSGGAISRVDPQANAFGNRDAAYCLESIGVTPGPQAIQEFAVHTGQMKREMQTALTGGVYMNFLDGEEAALRVRDAYLPETYARLQELKARFDPQNIFSHAFNIPPLQKG
jgi:FAD/FMN-containing dehydrogenase